MSFAEDGARRRIGAAERACGVRLTERSVNSSLGIDRGGIGCSVRECRNRLSYDGNMRLFFEYGIGSFPDFAYLYGRNAADAAESIIRDEKSRSLYRSRRECRQRTVHLPRCRRIVGRLPDRGCLYARGAGAQSPAGDRILQQTPPRDAGGPMRLIWPSRDWRRISTSRSSPRM